MYEVLQYTSSLVHSDTMVTQQDLGETFLH